MRLNMLSLLFVPHRQARVPTDIIPAPTTSSAPPRAALPGISSRRQLARQNEEENTQMDPDSSSSWSLILAALMTRLHPQRAALPKRLPTPRTGPSSQWQLFGDCNHNYDGSDESKFSEIELVDNKKRTDLCSNAVRHASGPSWFYRGGGS